MSKCVQELERIGEETDIAGAVLVAMYRNLRKIPNINREKALSIINSIGKDSIAKRT